MGSTGQALFPTRFSQFACRYFFTTFGATFGGAGGFLTGF